MPKEIFPSSYECDCGHLVHFFENTVHEMKRISFRKRATISEGNNRHTVIFHKGRMVGMYCPKRNAEIAVSSAEPDQPQSVRPRAKYTAHQGQVLAFIHLYAMLNRQSPAEADIAERFGITPASAHSLVVTLERKGLIERRPGVARSIKLRIDPQQLPALAL